MFSSIRRPKFVLGIIACLIAAAGFQVAGSQTLPRPTFVVSTEWVAERLSDENLVLLHVGNQAEYEATHLPGAHYISLSMIARHGELTLQMPPVDELKATFERFGISDDSEIVVYMGKDWATPTARLVLTLDYLGLGNQVHFMDGGMSAWIREGRPVTSLVPAARPGSITPRPRPRLIAELDWLADNLDNQQLAIIDARTADYYTGARGGHGQPRPGHIAGAGNIPFPTVLDDETLEFKDREALQQLFREAGARPGQTVVTYCHIGQQASLVWLAARELGYDARMYDGSFQEWSKHEELPVEWPAKERLAKLVSTSDLADMVTAGEVSIVDLRSSLFAYLQGHVPGAVYLHYETLRATKGGVPADLLPAAHYAALFSELGLSRERPVVIYTSGSTANFNATFLAWILTGFDHPAIYLLDGGYDKWVDERRPIERRYPDVEPSEFPDEPFRPHRADLRLVQWVVENADGPRGDEMIIVDVRPVDQYEGRAGAQLRRGHIPGAINHVWASDLVSRGSLKVWKGLDELRAAYEAQGITPDKHIILYCNTGTEASHVHFALRNLLGYPMVDVYIPSWTEWSEREDLPVERGATE